MRLVTFRQGGTPRLGRLEGEEIVDLAAAAPRLPTEMIALLEAGSAALDDAGRADGPRLALDDVTLASPVLRPPKILAVGLNYADHVAETGMETPKHPVIFNKQATSITGPFDPFHLPRASECLDYEGELAIVIGRRCRHVPKNRAHEVIAGYCVANDVSVRDWQIRVPTMTMGKSFDTHCPLGPALVTADEIGGTPAGHEIKTTVNGEVRQHSNTKELIYDCFDLVEHLSTAFTLEPGDVIVTGTPGGVGVAMKPPKWLVAGDVVRIEIEGIGTIENAVIEEPADTVVL
ncbi:MAG: fumarylacetoacetate hydrolase family protein [Myxococcota bacterium]